MRSKIIFILKKELRETFRDKKSLSMMLIIPFMIPLIIFFMSYIFDSATGKDVSNYNKIGFAYELSNEEKEIAKTIGMEVISGSKEELRDKVNAGEVNAYITKEDKNYTINSLQDTDSVNASALCQSYLEAYKNVLESEFLMNNNINPADVLNIIQINENKLEKESFMSKYIVSYTFMFIIMAITVSATYPATDTTAGEKERGTLETLLTFPIKSRDIILGKFFSVSISSIVTGIFSVILSDVTLAILPKIFDIYEGLTLTFSSTTMILTILVIISFSLLISGITIAIASKSKSFKEAQSSLTPLTFIAIFPGMFAYFAQLKTTVLLSLIPFLNISLNLTDISNKEYNLANIMAMFLSTIAFIAVILGVIIKQYKSEKVLFNK
ncbi:MAG: ABC transporter permease [Clostridia bacterium]|nr:ABC transporter permease [Clostridia bacterium]